MTSTNDKNKILGYHTLTPTIKKVSVGKIKEQIIKDRFELEADDKELEHISDIPVEVLFSHESRRYIPVKGRRIVHAGIEQGIKKFTCMIIGEVDYDHEAIAARLAHIFATVIPFHILEECRAIYQSIKLFGDTYVQGGNRRGENYKKNSAISILCELYPHRRSRIDELKRFVNHVGPLGIEGFYYLLKEKNKELSLALIKSSNTYLREIKMKDKIIRRVRKLQKEGKDEAAITNEIGIMIFDFFFVKPISENVEEPKATGGDDSGDDESDGGSTNHKESNGKDKSARGEYRDIGSADYKPIKQSFNDLVPIFSDLRNLVNSKHELKAPETEKIYKMGEDFQEAFEMFWVPFITAGVID